MATVTEAVRRLRIEATSVGQKEAARDAKDLAGAMDQVATSSERVTVFTTRQDKAMQSAERGLNSIQRRYDATYRAQQELTRVEKILQRAQEQGLVEQERRLELLRLTAERHGLAVPLINREAAAMDGLTAASRANAAAQSAQASAVRANAGQMRNLSYQLVDIGQAIPLAFDSPKYALQNFGYQIAQIGQLYAGQGGFNQAVKDSAGLLARFAASVGPAGIALAGLGLGVVAIQFLAAREKALAFEDALELVKSTSDNLKSSLDLQRMSAKDLAAEYGSATTRVIELSKFQAELRAALAADALGKQVDVLTDSAKAYYKIIDAGRTYANTLRRIERDFALSTAGARQFESILTGIATGGTLDAQRDALEQMKRFLDANNIAASALPPELASALDKMVTLSNETDRARALAERLRDAAGGIGGRFSAAAAQAERLADAAQKAASSAAGLSAGQLSDLTESGIRLRHAGNPIGEARALARQRFDASVGDTSGLDPVLQAGLAQQRAAFIENAIATERNNQALAAWRDQQKGAASETAKLDDAYKAILDDGRRTAENFRNQQAAMGLSADAAARLAYQTDLLNRAQDAGIDLTAAQRRELLQLGGDMASAELSFKHATQTLEAMKTAAEGAGGVLRGLADGTLSWQDALLQTIPLAIELLNNLNLARGGAGIFGGGVAQSFLGGLLGISGLADGGVMSGGALTPFASGGVVTRPTVFPMANGTGLMGEAGPEAIMPLRRAPNGRLGVEMARGANNNQPMAANAVTRVRIELGDGLEARIIDQANAGVVEIVRASQETTINAASSKAVRDILPGGKAARGMQTAYGLSPKGRRAS